MTDWATRFWTKVRKGDGCWEWTAGQSKAGYGLFWLDGGMRSAHRVAYELEHGPIPDGLQIDHLCRNRLCVRASHMEAVTQRENVRRGEGGRHHAVKTHCPQGHAYDAENTYVKNGRRNCRTCQRDSARRHRERSR